MKPAKTLLATAVALFGLNAAPLAMAADPDWARQKINDDVKIGFEIAPVQLTIGNRNSTSVALGSYIVNANGGCNDCHTSPSYLPGGNPFLGQPKKVNAAKYLAGGQAFGPGIISSNLTPDSRGRPAGLTLAQFKHVIRTGEDPNDPGTLLQVMPWPTYQSLSDSDLTAIYAYLQSIPSRPNNY